MKFLPPAYPWLTATSALALARWHLEFSSTISVPKNIILTKYLISKYLIKSGLVCWSAVCIGNTYTMHFYEYRQLYNHTHLHSRWFLPFNGTCIFNEYHTHWWTKLTAPEMISQPFQGYGCACQNLNASRDLTTPLSGMPYLPRASNCYWQSTYQIWSLYLHSLRRYERRYKMSKMGWIWVVRVTQGH